MMELETRQKGSEVKNMVLEKKLVELQTEDAEDNHVVVYMVPVDVLR
jgi:hypothetical protein